MATGKTFFQFPYTSSNVFATNSADEANHVQRISSLVIRERSGGCLASQLLPLQNKLATREKEGRFKILKIPHVFEVTDDVGRERCRRPGRPGGRRSGGRRADIHKLP